MRETKGFGGGDDKSELSTSKRVQDYRYPSYIGMAGVDGRVGDEEISERVAVEVKDGELMVYERTFEW